jgi:hypothetical protein
MITKSYEGTYSFHHKQCPQSIDFEPDDESPFPPNDWQINRLPDATPTGDPTSHNTY